MYEIEKGVPIPDDPRGRRGKYPFKDMEVGDSFFVSCDDEKRKKTVRNSIYASRWRREKGYKFKCSLEKEGIRVWRVK